MTYSMNVIGDVVNMLPTSIWDDAVYYIVIYI